MILEDCLFGSVIGSPREWNGCTPLSAVGADGNASGKECAGASAFAGQVLQLVELADGVQIDCQLKRFAALVHCCEPDIALIREIE